MESVKKIKQPFNLKDMPQVAGTNRWSVNGPWDLDAAFRAVEIDPTITIISIEKDVINTPNTFANFILPKSIANPLRKLEIEGNGVIIYPKAGQTAPIWERSYTLATPPTATQKENTIIIRNVNFVGTNAGGLCAGMLIEAATDVIIDNCKFTNVTQGLILSAVLGGYVTNCVANKINNIAYLTTYNNIWGTKGNAYSRNITFNKCNSKVNKGAIVGFNIVATPNVVLNDCIVDTEPIGITATPCYDREATHDHVYFNSLGGILDTANAELVNNFNIVNLTVLGPAATIVKLRLATTTVGASSYAKINGLHINSNALSSLVVDADTSTVNSGYGHVYVYNVPYIHSTAKFKTGPGTGVSTSVSLDCATPPKGGMVWEFKETYDPNTIFSGTRWVNGEIPFYRLADNFSFSAESKQYLTNFMRINNKTVSQ